MNYVKVFVGTYIFWQLFWIFSMLVIGWGTFERIIYFLATDNTMMMIDLFLCVCFVYIYSMKDWKIIIKH